MRGASAPAECARAHRCGDPASPSARALCCRIRRTVCGGCSTRSAMPASRAAGERVGRLMRGAALRARPRGVRRPTDTGERSDARDRAECARSPVHRDRAESEVGRGLHVHLDAAKAGSTSAVVLDLFSRRVVGWSMQATMTTQLVTDALLMAVWRRGAASTRSCTTRIRAANTRATTFSGCSRTWASPAA